MRRTVRATALEAWLMVRGAAPGPLFVAVTPGGALVAGERLTPGAVFDWLAGSARATRRALLAADLRRTFILTYSRMAPISRPAGARRHASVQTTARYDRRGEHVKRRAVGTLVVPYVPECPHERTQARRAARPLARRPVEWRGARRSRASTASSSRSGCARASCGMWPCPRTDPGFPGGATR